jgi:hypothetical protein
VRGSSESAMPSVVLGDVGRLGRGLHGTERGDVGSTLRLDFAARLCGSYLPSAR